MPETVKELRINGHIYVTDEDIREGIRWSKTQCPISRAVRRNIHNPPGDLVVETGQTGTLIASGERETAIHITPVVEMTEWIRQFDAGEPVSNITLHLNELNPVDTAPATMDRAHNE